MEDRETETLAREIALAPMPMQELLRRAIELAGALNQFHRRAGVHGGVEPAAIILRSSGMELAEPAPGPRVVTPYTAPEQFQNVTDARSDIFAFGAVLYEMATGRQAFAGDSTDELKAAILEKQPAPVETLQSDPAAAAVYAALDRLVASCLIRNPHQRRQRMQNVLADLKLMSATVRAITDVKAISSAQPLAMPTPEAGSLLPAAPELPTKREAEVLSRVGFGQPASSAVGAAQHQKEQKEHQKRNWIGTFKVTSVILAMVSIAIVSAVAVLALFGVAGSAFLRSWHISAAREPSRQLGSLRFALPPPEQASYLSSPAISPDGKLLAFSAVSAEKKRLLWIRPLNSLKAAPIENTDDALAPFWSPDGKFIGFFAGRKLKKIAVEGGVPMVLCETDGLAGGGSWSHDGGIIFGRSFYDALYRVPAAGGASQRLTALDSARGERAHLWPLFLPDGKHFLFYALSEHEENNGISIGSLDAKEISHLLSSDTNAIYAELSTAGSSARNGYLLFALGHRLAARPFNAAKLTFTGESVTVADEINYLGFINLLPISASANGLLAYQSIDAPKRQLLWLDREGNQTGVLGEPGEYGQARISPDGTQVAVNRLSPNKDTADIWVFNLKANRPYQVTSDATHEGAPVWSPDGRQLVYFSNPKGRFDLFQKAVGPTGAPEILLSTGQDKYPNDWSADGRYLLFGSIGGSTNSDLWILPMKGNGEPFVYLQTVSSEGYAQFSPDGKWIAYQSDETGRAEVYAEPFPRTGGEARRWQISTNGGGLPKWRGDGKELFFITGDGKMMAVTVDPKGALSPSAPRMLFQTRALPRTWNLFDATQDGSRFLVNTPLEWASSSPITVMANWTEGFKEQ